MKKAIIPIILFSLLIGLPIYTEWNKDQKLNKEIESSLGNINISKKQSDEQTGYIIVEDVKAYFSQEILNRKLQNKSKLSLSCTYLWQWGGVPNATISAQGLDYLHYFANSYLIGFKPFDTKSAWVPLYTLALRKRYEFDHIQYGGLTEVWQNSRQAYYFTRGDCEDHSIILADWLISMGLDARVVLGKYKGGGHAWVVLLMNGKEYLLEATGKRKTRSINDFPLAIMVRGYNPQYQFNRKQFWFNSGSTLTRRYSGDHWVLKSRYVNNSNSI